MNYRRFFALIVLLLISVWPVLATTAQDDAPPCGYIDGFDLPVPDIDIQRTDFAIYRARYGGLHTGMDVAFEQLGSPVRAAARGRVTYSDPEGWDVNKGVVVVQHTLPDGTLVNTLYGHMEELNGYAFPFMDQCVERGDIVGAVGNPESGLPHLHYEIRTRYRHEGGPGYTDVSPLELGWLHPVDFTFLANIMVSPAYERHFTLTESSTLPPLALANGSYVITRSERIAGITADGQTLWEFYSLGSVTGMIVLPDERILTIDSTQQVLVLDNGSFNAIWQLPRPAVTPPILFENQVVFVTDDHRALAYTPDGALIWQSDPLPSRVQHWAISEDRLALVTQTNDLWILDSAGQVLFQDTPAAFPAPFADPAGGFLIAAGTMLSRIDPNLSIIPLFDTGRLMTADVAALWGTDGTLYLYPGEGLALYAYGADYTLQWTAYMPGSHRRAPYLGLGGGQLLYVLSTDGQLLAFATNDGHLVGQLALYDGGTEGTTAARWLDVQPDDTVTFSGGFLSVATINGLALLEAETAP